jgi:ABC-type multidrug transport system, ATPase and permease components
MKKSKVYRRLLKYYRKSLPLLILVIILVIYSAFANIYGTFMLKDVINAITNSQNDPTNLIYNEEFINLILKMIYLYGAAVIAIVLYTQIVIRISQQVIYQIRSELIEHVQKMPVSFFDNHKRGEIMSFFTNDVSTLYDALNISLANIIFSFSNIIGTIICMFLINTYLSLIVCVFIAAETIFILINSKMTQKYFMTTQVELGHLNAISEEDINGMKTIKSFNHQNESCNKFKDANDRLKDASIKSYYHTAINTPVISSLSYFNFAISCVVGCFMLVNGHISFGGLSSYLVYVRQSSGPFNDFTQHLNNILTAISGSERIFNFLDLPLEEDNGTVTLIKVVDNPVNDIHHYEWNIPHSDGTYSRKPLKGAIVFKNVSFSYIKNKEILHNISFYAKPGEKISFVGATGAGKTTIISLVSRFYNIKQGDILYDEINIKEIKLKSLRQAISCVTQDTHLFSGAIKDNIRYGRMHSTDEEVITASKIANADSFISRLPNGYDTILYDDGHNLSEGQRQLISLARVAITNPPLLILDEATSNIDTHTEKLVNNAMDKIMEKRTVLVIAHRLSTVRNCVAILYLENGKIKERGSHNELLAHKGYYYNLYNGKNELN